MKEERVAYAKRPANLSVSAELLDQARALEINLSATLERALEQEVRARLRAQWLQENDRAIQAYNERIERDGVWSEGVRGF
ncbi:acetoacetyl-CoA synthase [Pseudoxanthomonas composti]|uniref:Acetoacetyl-CoA synthase n=2 Tax=Pseudoxanthomonas composti TaxID=2137479 RepID=A0A4Q1JS74_9GAMM|nr:acetoacetyl-CoA synthase [Pseudoxanthomonas composti]